ncbi:MAG TPA: ABC transporter permease [Solirubrobacteraceae bacterium]|nr:ABC transporter permease [Solirubrobacteraceae bacterium]
MTVAQPTLEPSALGELTADRAAEVEPSAFGDDLNRFVTLTYVLAKTDFKLRYFGSSLGYLWSLIRPLLFFGVMYLVFTQVFHAGAGTKGYPVYLLNAIVTWTYFTETTSGCVQCMVQREGLLRKMRFPRLAIPLAVCLTSLFNFCLNFVAVLVFAAIDGVAPRLSWLEMPVLIALWTMLAVGLGIILSVLYVRFRDMQPIWEVLTQVLFYASPIIYVVTKYPASIQRVAMGSPIATLLTQMRHIFVDPTAPTAAAEIGGTVRLLIPIGIIVLIFVFGLWFFRREAPNIAEQL